MSLKETYSLAHSAQCKLRMAAERPDRNLRFLVGHAMHLDSLMLRIIQIEETVEQPQHASEVKFKGTNVDCGYETPKKAPPARKSPPPAAHEPDDDEDEDLLEVDAEELEDDGLGLTRFPSGSAEPPRYPEPTPQLIPSDGDSSSSDEDDEDATGHDPELLRELISSNNDGDEFLVDLYNDIKKCPCHKSDAPVIERMWELPSENGGMRTAVAEIKV